MLELATILDIELPVDRVIAESAELIAVLQAAAGTVHVVRVEKLRRTFVWGEGVNTVLVDLADIRAPTVTTTVGLENSAHLQDGSWATAVREAGRAVTAARSDLGLPADLETKSYLDVLPRWISEGS
jgi:hypothetical protein